MEEMKPLTREINNKYNIRITIESLVDSILMEGIKGYDILNRCDE